MRSTPVAIGIFLVVACELLGISRTATAQPAAVDEGAQVVVFTGWNRDLPLAEVIANDLRDLNFRDVRIDQPLSDQWMIGVQAAGHIGRYVLGFTELMFNDAGTATISGAVGPSIFSPRVSVGAHDRFVEWTGGMHVQFPAGIWRVRPYFGGAAGIVREKSDFIFMNETEVGNSNFFLYHIDAGVRVLATRNVGVSVEFRTVELPQPNVSFYRVLVGALFRLD
jgi:hypothetical protein